MFAGVVVRLRCAALLWPFLLFPLREMFPFKCYLPVSFKTSSSLFWQTAWGNGPELAHWASVVAIRQKGEGKGKEKGEQDILQAPPFRYPSSCLIFPSPQRMSYSIVGTKVCFSPVLPSFWGYTGAHPYKCALLNEFRLHAYNNTPAKFYVFLTLNICGRSLKDATVLFIFYFKSTLFRAHLWVAASLRSFGLFSELLGLFSNFVKNSTCNPFFLGPCDTEPLCIPAPLSFKW